MVRTRDSRKEAEDKKEGSSHKKGAPKRRKNSSGGVWPCKINGCNKQFAREADLKRHQRTTKLHAQSGFQCPQCEATFTRTDALRRHQKSRHNGVVLDPMDEDDMDLDAEHESEEEDDDVEELARSNSTGDALANAIAQAQASGKGKARADDESPHSSSSSVHSPSYYRHASHHPMKPYARPVMDPQYSQIGIPTSATRLNTSVNWSPKGSEADAEGDVDMDASGDENSPPNSAGGPYRSSYYRPHTMLSSGSGNLRARSSATRTVPHIKDSHSNADHGPSSQNGRAGKRNGESSSTSPVPAKENRSDEEMKAISLQLSQNAMRSVAQKDKSDSPNLSPGTYLRQNKVPVKKMRLDGPQYPPHPPDEKGANHYPNYPLPASTSPTSQAQESQFKFMPPRTPDQDIKSPRSKLHLAMQSQPTSPRRPRRPSMQEDSPESPVNQESTASDKEAPPGVSPKFHEEEPPANNEQRRSPEATSKEKPEIVEEEPAAPAAQPEASKTEEALPKKPDETAPVNSGGMHPYMATPLPRPEPMAPVYDENGVSMLNPAELLTQESLATPPPP